MVPHKVKDMYRWARYRAKKKAISFTLALDDIVIPMFCPILGIELKFNTTHSLYNSPTLDRMDNTKGYEKGNVWVISNLANLMKSNATPAELLAFSGWVTKTYATS